MTTPQLSVWVTTIAGDDPGGWQQMFDKVCAADRAGVDRVSLTGEHVVLGEHLDAYSSPEVGGQAGARHITGPDGHFLEPIVTMSMLAALTSRVRLTSGIMLAALRRPIVLAKAAATLDVLSRGRLDLGVGVGWQREEYEAAGLDFAARGRLLDHTLEVCQTLWRERVADYSSPELSFERIHAMPKPGQPDGVPIWVAGNVTRPAMRRLARFGAGWIPWGEAAQDPLALFDAIPRMRDAVAGFGRDAAEIQVAGGIPVALDSGGSPAVGPTMEIVPKLVAAGVTDVRLKGLALPGDQNAAEDRLAAFVAGFRAATT
jgi:probable F420-dependent oxidoreductase